MSNRTVLLLCLAVLIALIGRAGLERWNPLAPPPPPPLSGPALAAALERAMSPPMLGAPVDGDLKVRARVEDGVVFISRYFNRSCLMANGSRSYGRFDERHYEIDMREIGRIVLGDAYGESSRRFLRLYWTPEVERAVRTADPVFWNARNSFRGVKRGEPWARALEAASDEFEQRVAELGVRSRSFNVACRGHRIKSLRSGSGSFLIGGADPAMPQIARSFEALRRSLD